METLKNAGRWGARLWAGLWGLVAAIAVAAVPIAASAQNAAFEALFNNVCGGTTSGNLATLCGVSAGAGLATESENSLNPGQALASTDQSLVRAEALLAETLERLEEIRDEEAGKPTRADDTAIEFGRFSLSTQFKFEEFDEDRDDLENERGYDGETWTFQVLGDYRVSDEWVVGALLGFDRSDSDFDPDNAAAAFTPGGSEGGVETDTYYLNLFTSYNITDSLYVDGALGYGYADYDLQRNAIFLDPGRTTPTTIDARADTQGHNFSAGGGVGYDFSFGALSVGPYARANVVYTTLDGYTENDPVNTGLALIVEDSEATSVTGVLGARASYAFGFTWGVVVPQVRAEYEHEFKDDPRDVDTQFAADVSGAIVSVISDDPDRNYWNLGAGVLVVLPNGWMPFVDVEALVGHSTLDRARVTGGLRAEF